MTGQHFSLRGFLSSTAALMLLLVAVPALAHPESAEAPQRAQRSRPDTVDITSTSTASGQQTARPRGQARSEPSTSTRSRSRAVPRGSVSGSDAGRRRPHTYRDRNPRSRFHHDLTVYWGPFWYPWGGWYGGWWPYYYPYRYGYDVPYYPSQVRPTMGALDLDLRPEEARVYLNGQLIGIADNFDGWPRYLWLDQGTYDLVFYHEGYETIARQYSIYSGVIIDVEDRMIRGEATPPEELIAESTERRDERIRRNEERREAAERTEPAWKERVREERERAGDPDQGAAGAPYDARQEPARVTLSIVPVDAAIYLDGRFIGTADELIGGRATLVVDPGDHDLEVVRPGYLSERLAFSAESGDTVDLVVELAEAQ